MVYRTSLPYSSNANSSETPFAATQLLVFLSISGNSRKQLNFRFRRRPALPITRGLLSPLRLHLGTSNTHDESVHFPKILFERNLDAQDSKPEEHGLLCTDTRDTPRQSRSVGGNKSSVCAVSDYCAAKGHSA